MWSAVTSLGGQRFTNGEMLGLRYVSVTVRLYLYSARAESCIHLLHLAQHYGLLLLLCCTVGHVTARYNNCTSATNCTSLTSLHYDRNIPHFSSISLHNVPTLTTHALSTYAIMAVLDCLYHRLLTFRHRASSI